MTEINMTTIFIETILITSTGGQTKRVNLRDMLH